MYKISSPGLVRGLVIPLFHLYFEFRQRSSGVAFTDHATGRGEVPIPATVNSPSRSAGLLGVKNVLVAV